MIVSTRRANRCKASAFSSKIFVPVVDPLDAANGVAQDLLGNVVRHADLGEQRARGAP